MTVAARSLHQATVLVVARHCLVAVALTTFLDVPLHLHAKLALHAAVVRKDAVRPVSNRLGIVLLTRAVLGLTQGVHLVVFTLVTLFTLSWDRYKNKSDI